MTASERLRELAHNQGGDDVTFTTAEVLVIASLVEAAETVGPIFEGAARQAGINRTPVVMLYDALAALSQALEPGEEN